MLCGFSVPSVSHYSDDPGTSLSGNALLIRHRDHRGGTESTEPADGTRLQIKYTAIRQFRVAQGESAMLFTIGDEVDPNKLLEGMSELIGSSDRACAIVGGSLLEQALGRALKCYLHKNKKIDEKLFQPSGPLGAFATKIRLGYLIGMYGYTALGDFEIVKDIRNRFAHRWEINSFGDQQIKDWTNNFKLVDRYVADEAGAIDGESNRGKPKKDWKYWMYVHNAQALKKSARGRFYLTVSVLTYGLSGFRETQVPEPEF